MSLTINDVEKISFPHGFFGYRRASVEDFRREVSDVLQDLVDDISRLKKEIERLEAELEKYRASEKLLQESVILAQKSHDQIIAAAREDAEIVLREARLKAVELSREVGTLSAERERFAYEFHALLKGFLERLEQTHPDLATRATLAEDIAETAMPEADAPSAEEAASDTTSAPPLTESTQNEDENTSRFPHEPPR